MTHDARRVPGKIQITPDQHDLFQRVVQCRRVTTADELFGEHEHEVLWRGTRRHVRVLFGNIRELPDASLDTHDEFLPTLRGLLNKLHRRGIAYVDLHKRENIIVGDDGRPSTGWHAEFGDVDNDGRLDLFIAKGNVDQMPSNALHDPNNLLMQTTDGTFIETAAAAGSLVHPSHHFGHPGPRADVGVAAVRAVPALPCSLRWHGRENRCDAFHIFHETHVVIPLVR